MSESPQVSVIIPVYNQLEFLSRCLSSLALESEGLEVLVVDDASPQDPGPVVAAYPFARLIRLATNQGYAEANNRGLQAARGQYLLFLNSDTEIPAGGVAELVARLDALPNVGGVTPMHREPDGKLQRTCYGFPTLATGYLWDSVVHLRCPQHRVLRRFMVADWDHQTSRVVEHAQTSCLLISREVYERIGGMDPELSLFYNDTDFCYRMHRAGFPIQFVPEVEIIHHGGASVRTFERAEAQVYGDRYRYFRKWFGWQGGLAVRAALWSRVGYELLVELVHGQFRFAARKVERGLRLSRAMGSAR